MKLNEAVRILARELGVSDMDAINKALKAKNFNTRFRMTGPGFVNSGFTGLIKAITKDGIKIYNVSRVNLIRYEDIVTLSKALPKEEKEKTSVKPSSAVKIKSPASKLKANDLDDEDFEDEQDDDYENDDDFDPYADEDDDIIEGEEFKQKIVSGKSSGKKSANDDDEEGRPKKKKRLHVPGSGSQFIPKKK